MEKMRVLIVSDNPDRTNYLDYHVRQNEMVPIRYPNQWSAVHALEMDDFMVVVVDLTLPLDEKIELVKRAHSRQKDARIIVIGKTQYLKKSGVLEDFPSVIRISSIEEFPRNINR